MKTSFHDHNKKTTSGHWCRHGIISSLMGALLMLGGISGHADTTRNHQPQTRSCWIWYPENPLVDAVNQSRYFRRVVDLESDVKSGELLISADDSYTLFINGRYCRNNRADGGGWKVVSRHDLKPFLKKGKNVFAIAVKNISAEAGLLLRGRIEFSNGQVVTLHSDHNWQTSREFSRNWGDEDFTAVNWVSPIILGDAMCLPWANLGMDFMPYLETDEQAVGKRWQAARNQLADLSNLKLENEPDPTAGIVYKNGRPFIEINRKAVPPFMYACDADPYKELWGRQCKNLVNSGVRLLRARFPLKEIWLGPDKYSFTVVDDALKRFVALNPEGYMIIVLGLDAPEWWLEQHPQELVGYAAQTGIARKRNASYVSQSWRNDTKTTIAAMIEHIRCQPYAKRIVGYQIGTGVNGEWHYFGMENAMPDNGPAMTIFFRSWLKNKYAGKIALLQQAWKTQVTDFNAISVPSEKERQTTGCMVLRYPEADAKVLDYYECLHEAIANTIMDFAMKLKELTGNRLLVGSYYGYFFGMPYPPEGFHLNLETLLKSPAIDFLQSPYSYDRRARLIGGDGLNRSLPDLFRLYGKLHFMEDDTYTHLSDINDSRFNTIRAFSAAESLAIIERQLSNAICRGFGIQWIEFHNSRDTRGWFEDRKLLAAIKRGIELYTNLPSSRTPSSSQVCVVLSPLNIAYVGYPAQPVALSANLLSGIMHEMARTGIPYDVITLDQLGNPKLPDYRCYLFLNCFRLTEEEKKRISHTVKRDHKMAIWLYAAGGIADNGISDKNITALTEIKVRMKKEPGSQKVALVSGSNAQLDHLSPEEMVFPAKSKYVMEVNDGPTFSIDDTEATLLGRHQDSREPALAVKNCGNWTSVYCAAPFISRAILAYLMKRVGIHQYIDSGDVIYANYPYLAIHVKIGGIKKIMLPEKAVTVTSLFDDKIIARNVQNFSYDFQPDSTLLLVIDANKN